MSRRNENQAVVDDDLIVDGFAAPGSSSEKSTIRACRVACSRERNCETSYPILPGCSAEVKYIPDEFLPNEPRHRSALCEPGLVHRGASKPWVRSGRRQTVGLGRLARSETTEVVTTNYGSFAPPSTSKLPALARQVWDIENRSLLGHFRLGRRTAKMLTTRLPRQGFCTQMGRVRVAGGSAVRRLERGGWRGACGKSVVRSRCLLFSQFDQ